jgi:hypothetical protein
MDYKDVSIINEWHRKTKIIWIAILSGMMIVILTILLLHQLEVIKEPIANNPVKVNQSMLLVVFVLAALIIILRRTLLIKEKLILSACKKININPDEADVAQKESILKTVFKKIQISQFVIWFMADMIVIIGLLNYLFISSIQASAMYCVVGLYSMLISYPRLSLLESCYYRVME